MRGHRAERGLLRDEAREEPLTSEIPEAQVVAVRRQQGSVRLRKQARRDPRVDEEVRSERTDPSRERSGVDSLHTRAREGRSASEIVDDTRDCSGLADVGDDRARPSDTQGADGGTRGLEVIVRIHEHSWVGCSRSTPVGVCASRSCRRRTWPMSPEPRWGVSFDCLGSNGQKPICRRCVEVAAATRSPPIRRHPSRRYAKLLRRDPGAKGDLSGGDASAAHH